MNRLTLVLGLGNPLMGDDGIGVAALETLRRGSVADQPRMSQ